MSAGRSLGGAVREAVRRLDAAGVASPVLDARLIVAHAAGVSRGALLAWPERPLAPAAAAVLEGLLARRAAREPVARLFGRREFWGLDIALSAAVLDPRPDSEALIEAALAYLPGGRGRDRAHRLLDLGTGSGCLLLALLSELPRATGVGVDISPAACRVARANARRLGQAGRAAFVAGDWGDGIAGGWDIVLCNPPYIAEPEFGGLAPEVGCYEPRLSLAAGPDGLACFRRLAAALPALLGAGGIAVLEIGAGQAADVAALLAARGLATAALRDDLAGRPRCLIARRPAANGRRNRQGGKLWPRTQLSDKDAG